MARVSDRISRGEYSLLIQSFKANDLDAVTGISSRYHQPIVYYLDISPRARTVLVIARVLRSTNMFVFTNDGRRALDGSPGEPKRMGN